MEHAGNVLAVAEEAVTTSTMDAAFEEKLKEGAEAFEFQAEVGPSLFSRTSALSSVLARHSLALITMKRSSARLL